MKRPSRESNPRLSSTTDRIPTRHYSGNCCSIRRSSVRALYIPDEDRQPSPAPPKFLPRWRLAHTARAKPGDAYDKARGAFDRIDRSRRPVLKERPAARQLRASAIIAPITRMRTPASHRHDLRRMPSSRRRRRSTSMPGTSASRSQPLNAVASLRSSSILPCGVDPSSLPAQAGGAKFHAPTPWSIRPKNSFLG